MGGTRRGPQEDWEAEVSLAAIGWSRSGSCPGRVAPEGPPAPGRRASSEVQAAGGREGLGQHSR